MGVSALVGAGVQVGVFDGVDVSVGMRVGVKVERGVLVGVGVGTGARTKNVPAEQPRPTSNRAMTIVIGKWVCLLIFISYITAEA
jgi:hypothetical protein